MNARIGLSVFAIIFVGLVAVSIFGGAAKQNLDMDTEDSGFGGKVKGSTPVNGIPGDLIRMSSILEEAEELVAINAHAKRETIEGASNFTGESNPVGEVTDYTDESGNILEDKDYYETRNRWPKEKRLTIIYYRADRKEKDATIVIGEWGDMDADIWIFDSRIAGSGQG